MSEFSTPMMQQYSLLKKQYPDCMLFFRLGDFYELFLEDAKIGAEVLDITLTSRSRGKDGRIPMAGVPYHAVDSYLSKLVKAGYKVAICEQVGDTDNGGKLVERDVVRIVTPGTVMDDKSLEKSRNNYVLSIHITKESIGFAVADVSTGDFQVSTLELDKSSVEIAVGTVLSSFEPKECILPYPVYNNPEYLKYIKRSKEVNIYCFNDWEKHASNSSKLLRDHFSVDSLEPFGLESNSHTAEAAAALLGYLKYTQKDNIKHIKKIKTHIPENYVGLDPNTIFNLELFRTIREGDKNGSLINVLDKTSTSMGARTLRSWVSRPLTSEKEIEVRHSAVEELLSNREEREIIKSSLKRIADIERIISRLSVGIGNARDLIILKQSLDESLKLKKNLSKFTSQYLKQNSKKISEKLFKVTSRIGKVLVSEPPADLKSGGLIRPGVDKELDRIKDRISSSQDWISGLEKKERQKTGITSLKVGFNKVFGYYIEVSKSNTSLVPKNYVRKQTLVNAERYITPELKKHEEVVLAAEEEINDLEYKIFLKLVEHVLKDLDIIQQAAVSISETDCILGFSELAEIENYIKPKVTQDGKLRIINGRHPVVEKLLNDSQFVPNDTFMDHETRQLILITGPNMAGKSVYIRQVAVITLLAQIGSFVPADEAEISIVDRIFVRSGASDFITSGLSTFMVEMVETAYILNHATKKSLIILDEIGRGTSTYDGLSIAWAVAEYLVSPDGPNSKTLFATHYHELQELDKENPLIRNYQMGVQDEFGEPVFLYKVFPGGASHSYGVAVAKLAGVPKVVTDRALEVLNRLEGVDFEAWLKGDVESSQRQGSKLFFEVEEELESGDVKKLEIEQESLFDSRAADLGVKKENRKKLVDELKSVDTSKLTPIEVLRKISEIQDKYADVKKKQ